jgi:hypothetical protein
MDLLDVRGLKGALLQAIFVIVMDSSFNPLEWSFNSVITPRSIPAMRRRLTPGILCEVYVRSARRPVTDEFHTIAVNKRQSA